MLWEITDIKDRRDHTEAKVLNHPKAVHGWISYAKVLMENQIGRMLEPNEIVVHIDSNPFNNDLSNLKIVTQQEHMKYVREKAKQTHALKKVAREKREMEEEEQKRLAA